MELAPRVSDAAAITAKFEVPTMQAAECVVCHKVIDPVAGLFQDYYSLPDGLFGPRKDGWFKDEFGPGFEGEDLPPADRWRALQWLGERTAKDPRFASTMVEHVYNILTGRKVLLPPKAIDDPLYNAKQRAYQAQRNEVERIAKLFTSNAFNLKGVFQEWIESPFYRAAGRAAAPADTAERRAAGGNGGSRHRADAFARAGRAQIDRGFRQAVGPARGQGNRDALRRHRFQGSDRARGRSQRRHGRAAAHHVRRRRLQECRRGFRARAVATAAFPGDRAGRAPGRLARKTIARIHKAIVYLHRLVLGEYEATESDPEVERTFRLFSGILADAHARKGIEPRESYFCGGGDGPRLPDPNYTVRAWRGVVTYLLRQESFLYE